MKTAPKLAFPKVNGRREMTPADIEANNARERADDPFRYDMKRAAEEAARFAHATLAPAFVSVEHLKVAASLLAAAAAATAALHQTRRISAAEGVVLDGGWASK